MENGIDRARKLGKQRQVPYQDVPFFYTPSHLSELWNFKSMLQPMSFLVSYLNSVQHNSVI